MTFVGFTTRRFWRRLCFFGIAFSSLRLDGRCELRMTRRAAIRVLQRLADVEGFGRTEDALLRLRPIRVGDRTAARHARPSCSQNWNHRGLPPQPMPHTPSDVIPSAPRAYQSAQSSSLRGGRRRYSCAFAISLATDSSLVFEFRCRSRGCTSARLCRLDELCELVHLYLS